MTNNEPQYEKMPEHFCCALMMIVSWQHEANALIMSKSP